MFIIVLCIEQLFIEGLQLKRLKWDYFGPTNIIIDLLPNMLIIVVVIMYLYDSTNRHNEAFIWMQTFSILLLWVRAMFFVRMIELTSFFFRIFMKSLSDLVPFMIFFVILLLGFTDVLFKLSVIGSPNTEEKESRPIESWPKAIIITYRYALGDLGVTDLDAVDEKSKSIFILVVHLITLVFMIILLNVLIAIVSATYEEVMRQRQ